MRQRCLTALALVLFLSSPVLAEGPQLVSWGPRVGLASDPDQLVGGVHWNLGKVHSKLRFVPNVQVGFGDDQTVVEGTAPVHWMFENASEAFTPYAGGGLAVAWVHRDLPAQSNADDTDVELGLKATGGMEWRLKNRTDFFVELSLVFGDIHDFQAVAGWSFRRQQRQP